MTHNINTIKMYLGTGVEFYPAEKSDLYYDIYADYPTGMLYNEALEIKEPQAIELSKSTIKQKEDFIAYEDGELFLGQCVNSLGFDMDDVFLSEVRLCLHPMTDLNTKIHEDEDCTYLDWIASEYNYDLKGFHRWGIDKMPFEVFNYLIEHHFNIFNLHPSLWVEKQTIKK